MPLYEYICKECSHHFELITHGFTTITCPECETQNIEKQLSTFAVSGGEADFGFEGSLGGCGTCGDPRGPRACSMNRKIVVISNVQREKQTAFHFSLTIFLLYFKSNYSSISCDRL